MSRLGKASRRTDDGLGQPVLRKLLTVHLLHPHKADRSACSAVREWPFCPLWVLDRFCLLGELGATKQCSVYVCVCECV